MRLFPKFAIAFLILVFTVLLILILTAFLLQDNVSGIIVNSLNKNISTRIETGQIRLSFIKSFPRATIVLKNVVIHSSQGFNQADFPGINTDTLLYAKTASLILRPLDIIKGRYNIEMITIRSGSCTILCDESGKINYVISRSENSSSNPITIDLQKIILSDVIASYHNIANKIDIWEIIRSGNLKSRISGDKIDFTAESVMSIDSFHLGNIHVNSHLIADIDLKINSTKEGISFSKSSLKLDDNDFIVEGTISSEKLWNLIISGNNIDLARFTRYLPEKYSDIAAQYNPSGKLVAECSINGMVTQTKNPRIDLIFHLADGRAVYRQSGQTISNISFDGRYSNGAIGRAGTSSISIDNLKFKLASSEYSGSVKINNLVKPHTEISLAGKVFPSQVRDFFAIQGFPVAEGSVDVNLQFKSDNALKVLFTKENLIDNFPEGNMLFNSFSLGGSGEKTVFRQVNGFVSISDRYIAKDLTFNYKGHKIGITGEFRNLAQWLAGRHITLVADADVSLDRYVHEAEILKTSENPAASVSFPSDMIMDLRFRIDSVRYKTFASSDVKGEIVYKPRLLTFKSLNMSTLDGAISGDGFIAGNSNRTIISRGNFTFRNIDVKKAFTTFKNFGQEFIVAENLSGSLSGNVSILMPMDSLFRTKAKNVTAEGKYTLINGALINFEPVKQLSSFIELSELENIHFDKIENDFFIRNNTLFTPQMQVRSTAADLTVSGQHSFENNYEYHVKMLLSELLSKKRRGMKKPVTEFGAVQDDGLGRTSILLKVVNKRDDVKVSYDLKAAGAGVKNNLQNEKKNLKTILNEEYGWYKDESGKTTVPKASDKKRFNVTWDENDSVPKK